MISRKGRFLFPTLLLFTFSCENIDCPQLSGIYRQQECIVVVKQILDSTSAYDFELKGTGVASQKDTLIDEGNRWYCTFLPYLSTGDTIVKKRGELTFNIHKKDTILTFYWDCEGKVGGKLMTAIVKDPFGNSIGLIYNPYFKLDN
ncbi:hypothetical protein LZQ00_06290 [Sphingobacterium sp. SRCM116780]|uniref:hypothetical protein n=1 Tax=Sphingobacterium sp. SRCM116780 TaxID=2907623 RepID=UPI001F38929A|nr:hypothetical protein [Sphingobacterium sp. SRCM116780]UIR57423.1 hypothetical protein LZQ00_06290 [Sphingobacterium sp. SRCM116780]